MIKYKHQCSVARMLSIWGMESYYKHLLTCKKCNKKPRKLKNTLKMKNKEGPIYGQYKTQIDKFDNPIHIKAKAMYRIPEMQETSIETNESYEAERIEEKVARVTQNNEPITDGAPIIYTERKDGVQPAYNIRTDRWEIALDAMDIVSKTHQAKREERQKIGEQAKEGMKKEGDGKPESAEGTK